MPRPISLSRDEAEFIVDACEKDGAPQWFRLQDELRRQWGMIPREPHIPDDGITTKDGAA